MNGQIIVGIMLIVSGISIIFMELDYMKDNAVHEAEMKILKQWSDSQDEIIKRLGL